MHDPRPIALLLPSLNGGGAERVALTLAAGLQQLGWEVEIVTFQKKGEYLNHVPPSLSLVSLNVPHNKAAVFALRTYIKRNRPAHVMGFLYPACIALMIAVKTLKRPPKTWLRLDNTLSMQANYMSRFKTWRIKKLFPHATGVIAVSQGVADDYQDFTGSPGDLIHTLYNPIPVDTIIAQSKETPAKSFTWHNPELPLIVAMGRLSKQKDYPTLFKALAYLKKNKPVNLLILGTGELRDRLQLIVDQHELRRHVIFGEFQANPYPFIRQADLFVLSSEYEGFGNVLVEAMACGTPVISTNSPHGPSEILCDGRYGVLVPPRNPIALSNGIIDCLVKKHDAGQLLARARDFDAERITAEYDALLRR